MLGLILGLILFLGIHLTQSFAPNFRADFIAKRGAGAWKALYTIVSLVGFVLMVTSYSAAVAVSPVLYEPANWLKHLNALLMLAAFLVFATYLLPAGKLKAIFKHPMLLSVKIWALGHLLANGSVAAILLFGSFLAWAIIVRVNIKKREAAGISKPVQSGPIMWDVAAIVLGLALYLLFVAKLHIVLFGVMPIAMS